MARALVTLRRVVCGGVPDTSGCPTEHTQLPLYYGFCSGPDIKKAIYTLWEGGYL